MFSACFQYLRGEYGVLCNLLVFLLLGSLVLAMIGLMKGDAFFLQSSQFYLVFDAKCTTSCRLCRAKIWAEFKKTNK
jgi:hypothetical protein